MNCSRENDRRAAISPYFGIDFEMDPDADKLWDATTAAMLVSVSVYSPLGALAALLAYTLVVSVQERLSTVSQRYDRR